MPGNAAGEMLRVDADGLARLDRKVYTDPAIFELEMERLWHRNWLYVAHESQLPNARDYVTAHIGRQPVILMRDEGGQLRGFLNACSHRGALLLAEPSGTVRNIVCPYHAWSFNTRGELLGITAEKLGAYPPSHHKEALGLQAVPRVEAYKGLIFASLDPDVMPLREHLGDAAVAIDLLMDQSPAGWEVLKGRSTYTYEGNWKLQAENAVDGYHAPVVHGNFSATIDNRKKSNSAGGQVTSMAVRHDAAKMAGGYFDFGRGHVMIWRDWDNPEDRFNYDQLPDFEARMGATRAKWAVGRLRNLLIFPNLMIMDQMSTQLRTLRPVTVDHTEVTGLAIAPKGESGADRRKRLRFYEDFFNPSGMATPDDLELFNRSQRAFHARAAASSDLSRGARHQVQGANSFARELGIEPVSSGSWIHDEGIYVGMYRAWAGFLQEE
ncbi:aromatic ring-hydroxylating oxygenase subunit alpha [Ramlibacter albus]|uniref:Rieske 2Fe-2S domain-containing protein n=1 Tax=Ramlibacter albus TaxID=2079448 RepID=A0A923M505_9BURK|nr:aromatic ring-hydroxylating dioxygenase subunit alpha [Ramlibacter albus]MBC5763033.1 Rieske 2Fe-2S domain-containing protein [Ramlibacter albus]